MGKVKTYPASCSTCVFVGNGMCQKGLDNHIKFPNTWDLKKTVCFSYTMDTFIVDIDNVIIKYSMNSPFHFTLAIKAKKERRRLWFKNLFKLKLNKP